MAHEVLINESDLLERVSGGDVKAFKQLFDFYRNKIYSLGMHFTHSESLSEELVQDVFMKVWNNRLELATIQYFNSWLRTVARNICSNYLRDLAMERLTLNKLQLENFEKVEPVDNALLLKEYEQLIYAAIQQLPQQQRRVYLLSKQLFKKQDEIAKEMNISIYTVKEYMKLAQRSIKKYLQNKAVELIITFSFFLK